MSQGLTAGGEGALPPSRPRRVFGRLQHAPPTAKRPPIAGEEWRRPRPIAAAPHPPVFYGIPPEFAARGLETCSDV